FVSDNNDRIGAYWSKPLDHSRVRAVNLATKDHYFKMLREVIKGSGEDDVIPSGLQYGVDEFGFQKGVGQKERVFMLRAGDPLLLQAYSLREDAEGSSQRTANLLAQALFLYDSLPPECDFAIVPFSS
ncbi:hypothetical protein F5888DRAFT_1610592, partial [Russula emetica]